MPNQQNFSSSLVLVTEVPAPFPWYAVRTRSNCEKTTSAVLAGKGYPQYLPFYRVKRRWSDRVVNSELPLFPGYVFCRFDPKQRLPIISTPGVFTIVAFGTEPAAIPDSEIEAIQTLLRSGFAVTPCPFLREGERIRIRRGALENLEGILVKKKNDWRMIISVTMLQRSISVEIDRECISTI